ncbi:hypothetical protein BKA56DRAFT_615258 [Ilyonectria sp. MPI-CAGE-AT-0026]|nr:hypothetical protein BKA56DRAFT_615258 [Ilyonectria sp. MPI-CAGE-AT-0026]
MAVSQRVTKKIPKIIFWYVAVADSTTARDEGTKQEYEEFDTVWADFDSVSSTLSFDGVRRITQATIAAFCKERRQLLEDSLTVSLGKTPQKSVIRSPELKTSLNQSRKAFVTASDADDVVSSLLGSAETAQLRLGAESVSHPRNAYCFKLMNWSKDTRLAPKAGRSRR